MCVPYHYPLLEGPSDFVVIPEVTKGSFVSSDNSSAGSSIKVLKEPWRIFQVWISGWGTFGAGCLHFASRGNYGKKSLNYSGIFVEQEEECTGCRTMGNLISSIPQPLAIS